MKCIKRIKMKVLGLAPITSTMANCPTKPEVPIPAPMLLLVILRKKDDIGPNIADATMAGIHINGFFTILEI